MGANDAFWTEISAQVNVLRHVATADEVVRVLTNDRDYPTVFGQYGKSSGDAFFAGSGGDEDLESALREAGWTHVWRRAGYYWSMRAPDGSAVTYVEGDVYRGVLRPIP